jgi:hypothetical protein
LTSERTYYELDEEGRGSGRKMRNGKGRAYEVVGDPRANLSQRRTFHSKSGTA